MKVAVWHGLYRGGARAAMDQLTRQLAGRHHVKSWVLAPTDERVSLPPDLDVTLVPYTPRRQIRGASFWNDWLKLLDLRDIQRLERQAARQLDAGGWDVVLTSTLHSGQAPGVLRYIQTPSAYYCHEPPRRFFEPWCRPDVRAMPRREQVRYYYRRPAQRLLDEVIRRRDVDHVRRATGVFCNSEYTRQLVRHVYGRDSSVVYLGVDACRLAPPPEEAARAGVLSVGALEVHKGYEFLVRALAAMPADVRPELTIVGGAGHPGTPRRLRSLARRLGVRLDIRADVSDEELARLYRTRALFLFGAIQEPFGMVLLEAMAYGLPVVAVAEGGVPECLAHEATGLLTPRDPRLFAAAVERLLGDTDLWRSCRAGARETALRWSWERSGEALEAGLASLAA